MAILQVRDIDDGLYNILKKMAEREHRSLSQEVSSILQSHVQNPNHTALNATEEFLNLCGSWDDSKTSGEMVKDIKDSRRNSKRFRRKHVVFD